MKALAICTVLAFLGACASKKAERTVAPTQAAAPQIDAGPPVPIEHVESCPGLRAVWRGTGEIANFYETLTLVSDAGGPPVTIDLENIPRASWSFSIFSPDCKRVLLLTSRTGPFHLVRVDHFARYAAGEAPEFVLNGRPDPKGETGTGNKSNGTWVSNTEVDYLWGCCDPPVAESFVIPASK